MTEVKHSETEKKFEIFHDGKHAGIMTYTWAGDDKLIIEHTEVDSEFEGKGLAKQLVLAGIDYARKNEKKIMPLCSYAKSFFDRNDDAKDVLFK